MLVGEALRGTLPMQLIGQVVVMLQSLRCRGANLVTVPGQLLLLVHLRAGRILMFELIPSTSTALLCVFIFTKRCTGCEAKSNVIEQ